MTTSLHTQAQDEQRLRLEFYAEVGEAFAKAGLSNELFEEMRKKPAAFGCLVALMRDMALKREDPEQNQKNKSKKRKPRGKSKNQI